MRKIHAGVDIRVQWLPFREERQVLSTEKGVAI
jgi:hypothetical protein